MDGEGAAPAAGKKSHLVTYVIIGLALVVLVYLLASRSSSSTVPGAAGGLSDATQQALLAAQTSFDTNATQLAIAKSADAVQALSAYSTATDQLAATTAGIRGATQQAQIAAGSATQIAQIQTNGAVAIGQAQSAAAVGSAVAQASGTAAVAQQTSLAAESVASQQAQAQTNIANAQKSASEFQSGANVFTSLLGLIGL